MKTIIHVHQAVIRANAKTGSDDPPLIVKTYRSNRRAHEVRIHGPAVVKYDADGLACGARAWLETEAEVEIVR